MSRIGQSQQLKRRIVVASGTVSEGITRAYQASVSVSPKIGGPGTTFSVSIKGATPSASFIYNVFDPNLVRMYPSYKSFTTDSSGSATLSVPYFSGANTNIFTSTGQKYNPPAGVYTIEFSGGIPNATYTQSATAVTPISPHATLYAGIGIVGMLALIVLVAMAGGLRIHVVR